MEVDPLEAVKHAQEAREEVIEEAARRKQRLNSVVAVTIALLATFMGICTVKDKNTVLAMERAQADKIDNWGWYQARNIRHEIMKATADAVRAQALANPAIDRAQIDAVISRYEESATAQNQKMDEVRQQAEDAQQIYEDLSVRHDQFDFMEAGLAIAIAMLAITSLTGAAWLYWLSLVPTAFGVAMGLAGLLGWALHPELLARWLGA